jgi:hypothetical protein
MDLLDEFRKSDTLAISISGHYEVDPPLVEAGAFQVRDRRVPKGPGLEWALSPGDVGLPDLPVSLELRGEDVGVGADGRPRIRFTVDQDLGVHVPGRPVVVERARGAITLALSPAAATADGARAAAVALETVGEDNGFEVEVRVTMLMIRRRATVRVTGLRIEGEG